MKLTASDGKKYETDCYSIADILRLIQSIQSPKAEPFKLWLDQVGKERIIHVPVLECRKSIKTMILTTHAVVGATIVVSIPNHPILGFVLAFASHFLLDSIPHWDYKIASHKKGEQGRMSDDFVIGKAFAIDLTRVGLDALFGLSLALLSFYIFSPHLFWLPFLGVIGAILPDALQFVYFNWKKQPMISLQRFHVWMHARTNLNERPVIGISQQIGIILLSVFVFKVLDLV